MHFTHKVSLALMSLTGMTLISASAAHAQSLTLGQFGNTTLSGAATLTDTGTTASGTFTYDDNATGTPLASQNTYNYWEVDGSSIAHVNGGSIEELFANNTSTANVNGGTVLTLDANNTSTANVSGGTIVDIFATDTSTINVSGGSVEGSLYSEGYSTANVSGGSIADLHAISTVNVSGGSIQSFATEDFGTANISGGSIQSFATEDFGTANISGGSIYELDALNSGTAIVSGGSLNLLSTGSSSIIDLLGTGFTETGYAFAEPKTKYTVTGTLQDGTAVNSTYVDYGGTLEFNGVPAVPVNPVPEASSVVSLGLLLVLGLGGVAVSRKRKADAVR